MTARVLSSPSGPVVVALLSEWQAAGRFLHVAAAGDDPELKLTGYRCPGEAEALANYVNQQASLRRAENANGVRAPAPGREEAR